MLGLGFLDNPNASLKFWGALLRRRVALRLRWVTGAVDGLAWPTLHTVGVGYSFSLPAVRGSGSAREPGQCLTRLTAQRNQGSCHSLSFVTGCSCCLTQLRVGCGPWG